MFINFYRIGISLFVIFNSFACGFIGDYEVKISNNGPIVLGANITFTAELRTSDGKIPTDEFSYNWRDNLYPQNKGQFISNATSKWMVHYSFDRYTAGTHWVEVTVSRKNFFIDWALCRDIQPFEITDRLNGNLTLLQHNVSRSDSYVSNSAEVVHEILLTTPDLEYIKQNSSSISIYWYIDCNLVGQTKDLVFRYNYSEPDVTHTIHAFLVVMNITLSNGTLGNTTQLLSNLTSPNKNSSTEITTSSDIHVNTISDSSKNKLSFEIRANTTREDVHFNCLKNEVSITNGSHATHGLFTRNIRVLAPVTNVTVIGNQWIQHWDMLNLTITCQGSPPFKTCYSIVQGYYNTTGNETCVYEDILETCVFTVPRYFLDSDHYSVLLIIKNDITTDIRSIGVDVYEVKKQPQLSVIIVPVSAGIVAVVLIIFGIAYYIQSRNRFMVEVADFDFSTNASDMEYKTFRERLVEAYHNAFDKTEDFYEQDSMNTAPTNMKYGSMT